MITFKSNEPVIYSQQNMDNNKCFNEKVLHPYLLNERISNLMPAGYMSQNSWDGGNRWLKKQEIFKRSSWENI